MFIGMYFIHLFYLIGDDSRSEVSLDKRLLQHLKAWCRNGCDTLVQIQFARLKYKLNLVRLVWHDVKMRCCLESDELNNTSISFFLFWFLIKISRKVHFWGSNSIVRECYCSDLFNIVLNSVSCSTISCGNIKQSSRFIYQLFLRCLWNVHYILENIRYSILFVGL